MTSPKTRLFDLGFFALRNFRICEHLHAEFRGEVFNMLNHTNFSNCGAVFGSRCSA